MIIPTGACLRWCCNWLLVYHVLDRCACVDQIPVSFYFLSIVITVVTVKLCMTVVVTELYRFIPLSWSRPQFKVMVMSNTFHLIATSFFFFFLLFFFFFFLNQGFIQKTSTPPYQLPYRRNKQTIYILCLMYTFWLLPSIMSQLKQVDHHGTSSEEEDLFDNTSGCVRGTTSVWWHHTTSCGWEGWRHFCLSFSWWAIK